MRTRQLAIILGLSAIAPMSYAQNLTIDPKGAVTARLGYMPVRIKATETKPASVKKEPTYAGTPKYGVITLGNGPKSATVFVLDQPATGDWKIYVDTNQNGDLTDDGDGAWNKKTESGSRTVYGVLDLTLHASYGTKTKEKSGENVSLGVYTFGKDKQLEDTLLIYRESSRTGTVKIDGKTYKAILVENDSDGIYNKKVNTAEEATKTRPIWLILDKDNSGKYTQRLDVRAPFNFEGTTYEAKISDDGSKVSISKSRKVALDLTPKAAPRPALLSAGALAPEFVAEKWGGGDLKLSDYRGKVVILDFWATWCGPCQRSMPHIEKVSQSVKGKDVVVLGLCVWDDKEAYAKWVPENSAKYTFQFAFDPAAKSPDSIASKLFKVSGIPTTYIIDKDGKVVEAIVGYQDGDDRVEKALQKLGIN